MMFLHTGDPCNITTVEHRKPGIKRADIDPKDLYGYDQEELGKKNFILHGFDKSGKNICSLFCDQRYFFDTRMY